MSSRAQSSGQVSRDFMYQNDLRKLRMVPRIAETALEVAEIGRVLADAIQVADTSVYALAAPQIGLPVQVAIVRADIAGVSCILNLANASVVSGSGEVTTSKEFDPCFRRHRFDVPRLEVVTIKNVEIQTGDNGGLLLMETEHTLEGFAAVTAQHMIDYFRGVPICDVASSVSLNRAERGSKIGRNVPCPCGSGRKYKKCHLRN